MSPTFVHLNDRVAVQLAKLAGLRVIGSTGDDNKMKYLKEELGVDVAFNYKKQSVWDVLKENGPIDIYFDNVGGEQLDAALEAATPKGSRFIVRAYLGSDALYAWIRCELNAPFYR